MLRDPMIASADGWREIWRPLQTRPLTEFSFWLSYRLGGDSAAGFHAWNIALHAFNTALVWVILRGLLPSAAFAAAVVFALHPMQSEPVNYVFARSTLLMSAFCLVSLWCWVRQRFVLAAFAFAMALLAKEECVTFPLFLLLLEWSRNGKLARQHWITSAAMLALSLAAGIRAIAATAAIGGSGAGYAAAISPLEYFRAQGVVILGYVHMVLVLYGFTVDPQIDQPSWIVAIGAWALIAAACAYAIRQGLAKLSPWFWLLAGLILLAPSSSVFPAEDLAADRRMYLPLFAFGCLFSRLHATPVLAIVFAALSFVRTTQVWNSEQTLWSEAVERSPAKTRPKLQLARVSEIDAAKKLLNEAANLEPSNPDIPNELGLMLMRHNAPAEALSAFGKALALAPGDAKSLNNRGAALFQLGQAEAARQDFKRALAADPCLADARRNLQLAGGSATDAAASCPASKQQTPARPSPQ